MICMYYSLIGALLILIAAVYRFKSFKQGLLEDKKVSKLSRNSIISTGVAMMFGSSCAIERMTSVNEVFSESNEENENSDKEEKKDFKENTHLNKGNDFKPAHSFTSFKFIAGTPLFYEYYQKNDYNKTSDHYNKDSNENLGQSKYKEDSLFGGRNHSSNENDGVSKCKSLPFSSSQIDFKDAYL